MSKRLKKLIIMAVVMTNTTFILPNVNAYAADKINTLVSNSSIRGAQNTDGFIYDEYSNYVIITGYNKNSSSLSIPSHINGKPVLLIGASAFAYHTEITSVSLPDTLLGIDNAAFYCCSKLSEVNIPSSVTILGDEVFMECSNLRKVQMTDNITSIGSSTFNGCTRLTSVNLSNKLTSISNSLFYGCENITKIMLPEGITDIGKSAFYGCERLEDITIPESVTNIGKLAFSYCASIKEISIPKNVSVIGEKALSYCSKLDKIKVYNGETVFKPQAILPRNTPTIYGYKNSTAEKFANENNIKFELFDEDKQTFLYEENRFTARVVGVENEVKDMIIPDKVNSKAITSIRAEAFKGKTNIESVKVPESITMIGNNSFNGCSNLKSITLSEDVEYIGKNAFANCPDLIIYGAKNSYAEEYARKNNIKFEAVSESTRKLTYEEFDYSAKVTGVVGNASKIMVPEKYNDKTVTVLGTSAFRENQKISTVILPETLTTIGSFAFYNCTNLHGILIPKSVNFIGKDTFTACANLTIYGYKGSYAEEYAKNNSIRFVEITDSINNFVYEDLEYTLKVSGFDGEDTELNVPEMVNGNYVTIIGTSAFKDNKNIIKAVLPETIDTLGSFAFENCTNLKEVYIPSTVTYIGSNIFKGCNEEVTIYCEKGSYAEEYAKENNIKYVLKQ